MTDKKSTTLTILLGCTLLLAGLFAEAPPAAAQSAGGCLRPEWVAEAPTPSITAAQVEADPTDANLLALAVEARDYVQDLSILGQEGGPWRDGSVYLYVLDTTGYVWFHAAFPNLYELTVAGGARDAVTGEVIYDLVREAAQADPEGGFVEYHFDDPNDDSDSAEIPKTAFVRLHSLFPGFEHLLPPLIFASGFPTGGGTCGF